MNWVMLDAQEVSGDGRVVLRDSRADHLIRVLKVSTGSSVRIGVIGVGRGAAIVETVGPGQHVDLRVSETADPLPRRCVNLLLAMPRPKVMKRLWSPLASLGVKSVTLLNAEKVERCYFDTQWLEPAARRTSMIDGLAQSGEVCLPEVRIQKRLKPFIEDELAALFPDAVRLIAHPSPSRKIREVVPGVSSDIVLAVGPEGGWSPYELDLFAANGFVAVSLGPRVLRSDVAVISLLSLLNDAATAEESV